VLVATCQNSHGQRAKQAALISGQGHGHGRGRKGNPDSVIAAPAFCILMQNWNPYNPKTRQTATFSPCQKLFSLRNRCNKNVNNTKILPLSECNKQTFFRTKVKQCSIVCLPHSFVLWPTLANNKSASQIFAV